MCQALGSFFSIAKTKTKLKIQGNSNNLPFPKELFRAIS
jgi:hypothetical protein